MLKISLAEKEEAAEDVAFAITTNFNELPEKVRQILFTLAEKEEKAWAVASAIAKHFNELPEKVRQILFTLAEKEEKAWAVAFVIAKHFDYLPEIIRDELLLNLSNIKTAQHIVASILKLIPEPLRKKIKNRLKIKDEED